MPVSLKHPLHTHVVHIDILSIEGNELAAALEHGDGVEIGRTEAQAKRVDSDHAVPGVLVDLFSRGLHLALDHFEQVVFSNVRHLPA
jgi:hypothetical protein